MISMDHPAQTPRQYLINQPPYIPTANLVPEAMELIVPASALVANEVGYLCTTSPVQTYMYNLLSSRGFANHEFEEVVILACNIAFLKYRDGAAQSPLIALTDSVREAIYFYGSNLALATPELFARLDMQQRQAVASNTQAYSALLDTIDDIYGYGQSRQYTPPGTQPARHPVGRQNPGVHAAVSRGTPTRQQVLPNTSAAARGLVQPRTQEQRPRSEKRLINPYAKVVTQAPAEPAQNNVQNQTSSAATAAVSKEIEIMDRNQHMIVYFGKEYPNTGEPVKKWMEEAIQTHEASAAMPTEPNPYIDTTWMSAISLDELIASTRARYLKSDKAVYGIYQGFGLVLTPIFSRISTKDVFEELKGAKSFAAIARILKEYLDSVERPQLRDALIFVSQIDRLLTRHVNDFLYRHIEENPVSVTSFVEDAEELAGYLNRTRAGRYNVSFQSFQKIMLNWLFQNVRSTGNEVSTIFDQFDAEHGDLLTTAYGVLYIPATSEELSYQIDSDRGCMINSQTAPMLHRLLMATASTPRDGVFPSHRIFVTLDDCAYHVYRSVDDPSVFRVIAR